MTQPAANAKPARVRPNWRETAGWTAGVAGVFCAVVCALLLWNFAKHGLVDPVDSPEIVSLKAELAKRPADAALKEQIRALDLDLRRTHMWSRDFTMRGAWLLAGGMVVFLLCLKYAAGRKKLPNPKLKGDEDVKRTGRMSLGSVAVLAGLFIGFILGLVVAGRGQAPWEETKVAAQPAPVEQPVQEAPKKDRGNWPRFRGPGGLGIVTAADIPTSWDGNSEAGILWKSPVPLPGVNSPVVWGDRVFVTGADTKRRAVYCYDADTGKLLWEGAVENVPGTDLDPPRVYECTGYAAPSPATDGKHVYAMFANGNIAAFDFSGKLAWARALGTPQSAYGHAASLAIHNDLVLVQFDQASPDEGKSKLLALDCASGLTSWEAVRPVGASWATPIVINAAGRDQIIANANPYVIAHDAADGAELWRVEAMSGDVAPSPVFADGIVFACNTYARGVAIRPDGTGDVTKTGLAWSITDDLPDICSPLMSGGLLFLVSTYGEVACYDSAEGKRLWLHEFDEEFNSSPSLVGKNVYLLDTKGVMHMFEAAREFKEVGKADLGEESTCCPAFVDGRIYIRGKKNLYCVGKP